MLENTRTTKFDVIVKMQGFLLPLTTLICTKLVAAICVMIYFYCQATCVRESSGLTASSLQLLDSSTPWWTTTVVNRLRSDSLNNVLTFRLTTSSHLASISISSGFLSQTSAIGQHSSSIVLTMDDHADFDSVSWRNENESNRSRPESAEPSHETTLPTRISNGKRRLSSHQQHQESQAGALADPVDLGGIGDGVLECTVDSPLKENDGTKDAYVSYLITTTVRFSFS